MTASVEDLEWALRQYSVATDYLIEVLKENIEIPAEVKRHLSALVAAISEEWR